MLKTFGGQLRRGLAANQDETAESMRSSNVEKSVKHVILHSTSESGFEKLQSTCSSLRSRI